MVSTDYGAGKRDDQANLHPMPLEPIERPGPSELIIEAKEYIARSTITYAKTMPSAPHWYLVRGRPRKDPGHEALFTLCRDHYWSRWWGWRWWRSFDLDGWSWWIMDDGTIINTKPTCRAGWRDDPSPPKNWLPDEFRRDLNWSARRALLRQLDRSQERWVSESDHWGIDPDSGVDP